jgi:hypothetical protein
LENNIEIIEEILEEHNKNMLELKKEFQQGVFDEGVYLNKCIAEVNSYRIRIGDY